VAVRSEAEMNQIEHRRRSGDRLKIPGVRGRRRLQVGNFHWHRVDLLRAQRNVLQKTFAQVGEVPVRISGGSDSLVDLE
jgi:hypothetical protein